MVVPVSTSTNQYDPHRFQSDCFARNRFANYPDPDTDVGIQVDNSEGKNEGKENQTASLESNPTHILAESAAAKTSKG